MKRRGGRSRELTLTSRSRGRSAHRSGDWITLITNVTGTFTGEMALADGTVIQGTGKAFDVEFGQTTKWAGDQLIVISAFWDAALFARQVGLA
jgi:hypothetical protein